MPSRSYECFVGLNLSREHWSDAQPVRNIMKAAFLAAGLPYYPPHRFRDMLVQQAYRHCQTPELFKAWSQNFGHEGAITTLISYGKIDLHRQEELIRGAKSWSIGGSQPVTKDDLAELLLRLNRG